MNNTQKFINDMKDQYDMDDAAVLRAVQTDSQHEFIMSTQDVDVDEATEIICEAEDYLLDTVC